MQWRMEIGNFSNLSLKSSKSKLNRTKAPISCSVNDLNFMMSLFLYYTLMRFIMKLMSFCRVISYLIFVEIPKVILNSLFMINRFYFSYVLSIFVMYLLYNIRVIRLSSDIEVNPGPKPSSFKNFSICHWNLNSISSHDFLKVKLLTAYNALQNFDIICISESYLNSEIFHDKLESLQYKATLAITGATRGSSTEKNYEELGLESLKARRWYRKMCTLYKILKNESPSYLFSIIPNINSQRQTRNANNIPTFFARHDYFKNSFFPSAINEWNKLDSCIRNADSINIFKKRILDIIRPLPNGIFNIHNPLGIKYLTRLRIGFSHLKEHKFRHNFQDSIDPMCSCNSGVETTTHFFLHCANFTFQRQTLFDRITTIDKNILTENEESIINTLLFGKPNSENSLNKSILIASIEYILSTERFNEPLF